MFVICGKIGDNLYTVSWSNGKLTGDLHAIKLAQVQNRIDHGLLGLCPSVAGVREYITEELPAYCLLEKYVFDEITFEKNDWETIEECTVC